MSVECPYCTSEKKSHNATCTDSYCQEVSFLLNKRKKSREDMNRIREIGKILARRYERNKGV